MRMMIWILMPAILFAQADPLAELTSKVQKLTGAGDYREALALAPQLLLEAERVGSTHAGAATALNQAAVLYQSVGNYAAAEKLYKRALWITERHDEPSPEAALPLINLATLYLEAGGHAGEAESLSRRALKLVQAASKVDASALAMGLYLLGAALGQRGDHSSEKRYYEQALEAAGGSEAGVAASRTDHGESGCN